MGWLGGSNRSIESLVQAHYEALYRYAFRLSGNAQLAEDLTQETFCQAQGKLHQLRDQAKAKSWLFSILRNAFLHRMRLTKQEKEISLDAIGELPERTPDATPPIDLAQAAQLQQALDELPEAFRTPIILYYFEEFSYRDIAEEMNVPLGTVMSRLARAKTHLRLRLTDQSEFSSPPLAAELSQRQGEG
jgi:RNA polymerase sigma-70 factor (ECF subfamily)